jgi:hypothetical protein
VNLAKLKAILVVGIMLFLPASADADSSLPPFATPIFPQLLHDDAASDYRPVLNALGTVVIFERTFKDTPKVTKLYSGNFLTHQAAWLDGTDACEAFRDWNAAVASL